MNVYGKPSAYQVTQVSTSSKAKLILLMYDGAIRFINEARMKIETRDIAGRGVAISKAQKIIHELTVALDMNSGGEVAANLSRVYAQVTRHLINANIHGDMKELAVCLEILAPMREAWDQAINKAPAEQQAASQFSDTQGRKVAISL
ncbi:MAG: flagellar export chaperone FliS [Nitrospinae bacterium]|nr:flagellar export chaperone FliS [Nitrospinota bacterium]